MPIQHVKKAVKKAQASIQQHWTREEKVRREEMAELMQMQLMTALGFRPAPVAKK